VLARAARRDRRSRVPTSARCSSTRAQAGGVGQGGAVEVVTDAGDERIAGYARLTDAGHRRDGTFVLEGALAVERAVAAGIRLRSLLLAPHKTSVASTVPGDVRVFVAERPVLRELTGFDVHRGVLALGERPTARPAAEVLAGARLALVVEGVSDAENVGALFRNAAAFGAVVLVDDATCDPLQRRCVRVSVGNVLAVAWARGTLADAAGAGLTTVALTPAGDVDLVDVEAERAAVVVGAEGPGLSPEALAAADVRARIPMAPGVDSLNVATAAAIALHALG
jgi:tRNA G18 (ribose-2'-O)-methylase SpoU